MPNGIFPVPPFESHHSHTAAKTPGLGLRIRTRWTRNRLDQELAHDADRTARPELSLRAAQLRSSAERARLANLLVEALGDAGRQDPVTIRPRPPRVALLTYAEDLMALVARLRDDQPISVRGAAMTARLVSDRTSPLHSGDGQELQHAIRAATVALDATARATHDVARAA